MHDNKVRLSRDVLEKADLIAREWGLKNARAAVEAVFRCYSDHYLGGHQSLAQAEPAPAAYMPRPQRSEGVSLSSSAITCEALDALDDVLAL
ncbi:MAG: hypothetical protein WBA57_18680 [Elainellaceae cyanobacterium]